MKKWWKELTDKPLVKAFLHYYQASDSELTSVAVAYYWLISIFPLLLVVVNILPYFQIPVSNFLKILGWKVIPQSFWGLVKRLVHLQESKADPLKLSSLMQHVVLLLLIIQR